MAMKPTANPVNMQFKIECRGCGAAWWARTQPMACPYCGEDWPWR